MVSQSPVASLASLSPLTVSVRAVDGLGVASANSAAITLTVLPSYWSPLDGQWHMHTPPYLRAPPAATVLELSEGSHQFTPVLQQGAGLVAVDADPAVVAAGNITRVEVDVTGYRGAGALADQPIAAYAAVMGQPPPTFGGALAPLSDGSANVSVTLTTGSVDYETASSFLMSLTLTDGEGYLSPSITASACMCWT
jgi:hypothetical protein